MGPALHCVPLTSLYPPVFQISDDSVNAGPSFFHFTPSGVNVEQTALLW